MWALLGRDNKTVIGSFTPDVDINDVVKEVEKAGLVAIMMHINNTPAYERGYYENLKFYPPKGK